MGTRLEQLQAAAKAKTAAGQPIFTQQVSAPVAVQTPTPAVGVSSAPKAATPAVAAPVQNTASSVKNASALSPQIAAEVQRKASAGIALTNPTAATQSAYNAAVKPAVTAPKATTPAAAAAPTAAVAQPNTNYVQQGGKTLNDILYLKKSYESGKTGAAAYAGQYYNQLDPNTAAAVKNMNAAQLEQYISSMGQQAQPQGQGTPVAVATANVQSADSPYMQLSPDQIAQQADYQIATERANRQRVLDSTTAALKANYDYSNQITQDNRQLENANFDRNNAPAAWDGSQGYRGAMTDRNRSIQDTATQRDFNNQLATAQQAFADWDNLSTQQRQALVNDMTRIEREYGLQVGQLMGSFNGQRTLAGQAQDWGQTVDQANLTGTLNGQQTLAGRESNANVAGKLLNNQAQAIANQIAQIDLSTYPQQSALKLQQLQQQVNSGSISNAAAQYQLQELTNPNSVTNQAAALELSMKQIDASNYSEQQRLQLEQLRKTVEQIGKTEPVSVYEQQMQQLDLQKAQLQIQQLTAEASPSQMTAEDYATNYIDKSVQRDKKGVITNLPQVQAQILQSGLPDTEIAKLYSRYGIPLPQGYSGN